MLAYSPIWHQVCAGLRGNLFRCAIHSIPQHLLQLFFSNFFADGLLVLRGALLQEKSEAVQRLEVLDLVDVLVDEIGNLGAEENGALCGTASTESQMRRYSSKTFFPPIPSDFS